MLTVIIAYNNLHIVAGTDSGQSARLIVSKGNGNRAQFRNDDAPYLFYSSNQQFKLKLYRNLHKCAIRNSTLFF